MRHSQAQQILAELQAVGGWVSAYRLHELTGSLCVHSRTADLRKLGHVIQNRTRHANERTLSEYRLLSEAVIHPPTPTEPRNEGKEQCELAVAESRPVWPD